MDSSIPQGTRRVIDGRARLYYDGYWIREYEVPKDTLWAKKQLIEGLTRRLFNHVEHGINIPGTRLEEARRAFEAERDPQRKRVKGAMLAGATFNRAADIFTKLVEIQALGVRIDPSNPLMRECGRLLQEALSLGRLVLHRGGEEGIDELWGEPFKAFAYPIEEFYRSRYIKISETMRAIDEITAALIEALREQRAFAGIAGLLAELGAAAKAKTETLRTDPDVFDVWASFVVAGENLSRFVPRLGDGGAQVEHGRIEVGLSLVRDGAALISNMTRARVPMPKSVHALLERCQRFKLSCAGPAAAVFSEAGSEGGVGSALTTGSH